MGFSDVCCVVRSFVLLFLVQRHASVLAQVWRERASSTFSRTRRKRAASTKLSPPSQGGTDEQRSRSASDEGQDTRYSDMCTSFRMRTRILFQYHGTRTSLFVLLDLGTESFL